MFFRKKYCYIISLPTLTRLWKTLSKNYIFYAFHKNLYEKQMQQKFDQNAEKDNLLYIYFSVKNKLFLKISTWPKLTERKVFFICKRKFFFTLINMNIFNQFVFRNKLSWGNFVFANFWLWNLLNKQI